MELIYLGIVAVGLYFLSDVLLRGVEALLGRRLEQRSIVFFGLILVLSLSVFALIRQFLGE